MVGKGSITHNSRAFKAKNIKEDYTQYNIEYCNENIKTVYHELFDEALERYNEKQTRNDRKIDNYYEKIRTSKQEKLFHEVIFQIDNKDDMNAQSENGELAKKILDEFMNDFQQRNPNLRVFSAHLHMDEETPHLHIDFIPFVSESKRGLDTRISMKQALASMGFKGGTKQETEWSQWIASEKQELAKVMERHGIIWKQKGTHRKYLSVLDFEKQEREKEVQELTDQKKEISQSIQEIHKSVISETRDLKRLQGQKREIQQEIIKLSSDKGATEKNIHIIRENPAWQLPEPAALTTAKTYRDKKAMPLLKKVKETLVAALIRNVQLIEAADKLKQQVERLQRNCNYLEGQIKQVEEKNLSLSTDLKDYECVKAGLGEQEVKAIIEGQKAAEMCLTVPKHYKKTEVSL
ncbi:plasmid recombination protein [Murimonas intestini]|uniref:Plasmid recombination enzyme n=1 Tax=Murimonas intestini TaxID=1337051 RepID=A0AB73SZ19_9FIRM|nr:plasmid recombination protein [Murimonas intestini]MCR1842956.1 plasmid recombination protein [Murimonas intestini]MCR1868081.1 plasmid recombination protein [Murimonas intestini]MCR1885427.1 plasmid recombination protein [Murimonas intestini]